MTEPSVPTNGVITLRGVQAHGYHGVLPQERRDGQRFLVDAEITIDWPVTDDLSATVDYVEIAARILAHLTGEPRQLIEQVAHDIAEDLLTLRGVQHVRVRVHKPEAPLGIEYGDLYVEIVKGGLGTL